MKIIATNIGERKQITWKGKEVTTGIFKFPVHQPIFLNTEEVTGDEISDRKHHGGKLQAVYGYAIEHYDFWKAKYPHLEWQFGMFGENLTLTHLDETKIHQGDTFKVGETILEATVQRNPCFKLGIRFNDMKVVKQFWNTSFCGVYFKVLQTGLVKVGDEFKQIKSCPKNATIAELYEAQRVKKDT